MAERPYDPSERAPSWAKPKPRSCRTCVWWAKPRGTPARADYAYPCTAPVPRDGWPASVIGYLDKRPMERDEGQQCPAWADTFPPAPKPQP